MMRSHRVISASVYFTLILLLSGPALGQFKETYEPPGYILEWGSVGGGPGQFSSPGNVTVDVSGNVYVTDTANQRIQKFDGGGNYLTEWGSWGSGPGQFENPLGIAVDHAGNFYVTDHYNYRVQKFDSAGNYLTEWGSSGSGPGQFSTPSYVAVDRSGYVYVSDTGNHRIQKFDSTGGFVAEWGSEGSGAGQFFLSQGLAFDAAGNVYVADNGNHRIQKFDSSGNYLSEWGSEGSGAGQFNSPTAIAIDASGNVFVAESGNSRVQKFDSSSNYLTEWGSWGSGDGQFINPFGVAVDATGHVFVADTYNNRIQKFAPVLWFDVAGYDSYLSVATLHETTAVRTLFQLENNGAPRFAFKNTNSDIEWSFQQSGPGNFLISKEGTGGPEMQVFQNGRVRMGPSGAANFDLEPNGNLTIAGSLTAKGSTFPDYVFGPDYRLMSLEDVATFIEREKRLPGVPSAEEVQQKGGHNMTELQLKLLEKVEELMLYTLEQERRLKESDEEIWLLQVELMKVAQEVDSEGGRND